MSLTITVNGGGTFTASMEEGPVSFTASLAAVGPQGPAGANGAPGAPGQGVPAGGTTGQVLAKASGTNYDTAWVAANPFNQSLNTTDTVSFDEVRIPSPDSHAKLDEFMWRPFSIAHGDLGIEYRGDKVLFANETEQFTALPNGTADGYIVIWNAANSTYVSSPNETRALFMLGTNKTGTTIAKGKAVYVSGATGNHPEITLAQANSELASSRTIGITAEAIANNAEGRVIVSGRLENVDTSGFSAGDTLFLSPTTAGGFTTTFPTQPDHGVLLGYVTRANANTGVIEVVVKNYQELEEQSDVLLTSKQNNDLLSYESSSGLWKNKSFSTLGLLTSATAASTYAPIASPTFTGTVTIPAGASISGFAPLASPALTGTPTAPTAAASTNTTQIATTAFVQQEVPAASTTAAGKVELATDAEATAGTSTTLAVTPSGALAVALNPEVLSFFAPLWTGSTSGAGAAAATVQGNQRVIAPTTAVGYGARNHIISNAILGRNHETGQIDFNKRIVWEFRSARMSTTTDSNTVGRILLGKGSSVIAGNPTTRCIGIRISGSSNVELLVHDGTNLTAVSTSFAPTSSVFECMIVSQGNGTVTLFINGNQEATTNAGPTGNSATSPDMRVEAENLATISTTPMQLYLSNAKIRFAP